MGKCEVDGVHLSGTVTVEAEVMYGMGSGFDHAFELLLSRRSSGRNKTAFLKSLFSLW